MIKDQKCEGKGQLFFIFPTLESLHYRALGPISISITLCMVYCATRLALYVPHHPIFNIARVLIGKDRSACIGDEAMWL